MTIQSCIESRAGDAPKFSEKWGIALEQCVEKAEPSLAFSAKHGSELAYLDKRFLSDPDNLHRLRWNYYKDSLSEQASNPWTWAKLGGGTLVVGGTTLLCWPLGLGLIVGSGGYWIKNAYDRKVVVDEALVIAKSTDNANTAIAAASYWADGAAGDTIVGGTMIVIAGAGLFLRLPAAARAGEATSRRTAPATVKTITVRPPLETPEISGTPETPIIFPRLPGGRGTASAGGSSGLIEVMPDGEILITPTTAVPQMKIVTNAPPIYIMGWQTSPATASLFSPLPAIIVPPYMPGSDNIVSYDMPGTTTDAVAVPGAISEVGVIGEPILDQQKREKSIGDPRVNHGEKVYLPAGNNPARLVMADGTSDVVERRRQILRKFREEIGGFAPDAWANGIDSFADAIKHFISTVIMLVGAVGMQKSIEDASDADLEDAFSRRFEGSKRPMPDDTHTYLIKLIKILAGVLETLEADQDGVLELERVKKVAALFKRVHVAAEKTGSLNTANASP